MYNIQGVPKKNSQFMFCLIYQESKNKITNRFFPLKIEIHAQILNTEPFLCDLRGLRYKQNKIGFLRKVIVINFYFLILILRFFERWLKWTRKKNYLSSWGNLMLHRVTWGLSGSVSVCQGLVRAARSHFKAVRSIMCNFVYEFMC